MRKRLITPIPETVRPSDQGSLDLERAAVVEVTSEEKEFPVESALLSGETRGWRAASPGTQTIRLVFDEPQKLKNISLLFEDEQTQRTQEFVLRWSEDKGQSFREIVRQQWNFSPPNTIREIEEYQLELSDVTVLELTIVPDISGGRLGLRSRVCACVDPVEMISVSTSMQGLKKKEPPGSEFSLRAVLCFLLEKLDVFCLEALGPLDHVKLHRLAFLKATESIRLDGREMHENIIAGLTAKKAIALGVVKPLYCSLFQFVTCFYFEFLLRRIAAGERAHAIAEPTINCG
jgi:hypothetical protein